MGLHWEEAAAGELARVPFFIRPLVRRKVEERVAKRQGKTVTLEDFLEAKARFHAVAAGKSEEELKKMIPVGNQPGAEMVVVETCHHELANCPNVLIPTREWKEAIEKWLDENQVSEKLRQRIKGEKVLFHHKFKISISGCPNACSRPQIADFGLTGAVRPEVNPELCRTCGACAEVCPDQAITVEEAPPQFNRRACLGCKKCGEICPTHCIFLSPPFARISVAGKLGRHPRLAETIGEANSPQEALSVLARLLQDFLRESPGEERFADYYSRKKEERKGEHE